MIRIRYFRRVFLFFFPIFSPFFSIRKFCSLPPPQPPSPILIELYFDSYINFNSRMYSIRSERPIFYWDGVKIRSLNYIEICIRMISNPQQVKVELIKYQILRKLNLKNLRRRKCVRWAIFRNIEVKVEGGFLSFFATQSLGHCAICQGSSYTKNEYNLFYQKLDAEYFFIRQFFWKKQYLLRKLWKTVLAAHLTIL